MPVSHRDIIDREWLPENLCANPACGHRRNSHLGEAPIRGLPKEDDSGWCTKPAGTCIFASCTCTTFVEPDCAAVPDAGQASATTRVTFLVEYNDDPEITCLFCADAACDGAIRTAGTNRYGQKATRWHGVHRRCLPEKPAEQKSCSAYIHQIGRPDRDSNDPRVPGGGPCEHCGELVYAYPIDIEGILRQLSEGKLR